MSTFQIIQEIIRVLWHLTSIHHPTLHLLPPSALLSLIVQLDWHPRCILTHATEEGHLLLLGTAALLLDGLQITTIDSSCHLYGLLLCDIAAISVVARFYVYASVYLGLLWMQIADVPPPRNGIRLRLLYRFGDRVSNLLAILYGENSNFLFNTMTLTPKAHFIIIQTTSQQPQRIVNNNPDIKEIMTTYTPSVMTNIQQYSVPNSTKLQIINHYLSQKTTIQYRKYIEQVMISIILKMANFQSIKRNSQQEWPCARWGHATLTVGDQIYFFGGYENSKYYNDLWILDVTSMGIDKIEQKGDVPPPCSNFTLNYYAKNHSLILFGGGTLNKEKLNTIYELDIDTVTWSKIDFDVTVPSPWQRSYHCAQIIQDYLLITGGEFLHDLEDTWLFDLRGHTWTEVKTNNSGYAIKGRKFSSSFLHNNKVFVVGGCSGKYESLKDNISMDFKEFLASGNVKYLEWKQVNFKSGELLSRWGHISVVKDEKAYVFGGRSGNKDLENLIEVDLQSLACSMVDVRGNMPKGRRKPGLCMRNNSIFCFSGFDGSYVNDFGYFIVPSKIKNTAIVDDKKGKSILSKLICPQNIQQQFIDLQEQVLYVTEDQLNSIQKHLFSLKTQSTSTINDIDYQISTEKLMQKSKFFSFLYSSQLYKKEYINLSTPCEDERQRNIVIKMFLSYIEFGKVIVDREQFKNSQMHFLNLLDMAEYYLCQQLGETCKRQLLRFYQDEIVQQNPSIPKLIHLCETMRNVNKQYRLYSEEILLNKLVQILSPSTQSFSDIKNIIKTRSELSREWLLKLVEQHSFEISQQLSRKINGENENINILNNQQNIVKHSGKVRKGSLHFSNTFMNA